MPKRERVLLGLGYALTEKVLVNEGVPDTRLGRLGLLRAPDVPQIQTIMVRKAGAGTAIDGGVSGAAYGAKGIGEIATIPTAAAVANAYFARDGRVRSRLPVDQTPYTRG